MLHWNGNRVTVNGVTFQYALFSDAQSDHERFIIWKTPAMIDRLVNLLDRVRPDRILELGVAQGGSAALMNELAHPARLVTLDRRGLDEAPKALFDYISDRDLGDVLRPVYGVNQADAPALSAVLDGEFGDQMIDLVIDDASHQLAETRASFNVVFPRVRPGGLYMIEDWTWGHRDVQPTNDREKATAARSFWPSGPPLSVIAFDLIMAFGSQDGLIAGIDIDEATIHVWRGTAPIPAGPFDLASSFNPGGVSIVTDPPSPRIPTGRWFRR